VITIEELSVADAAGLPILDRVSLDIGPGERVGVVGESGAGKTTLALALVGAVRPGLRVVGGAVLVDGLDALSLRGRALRDLRRHVVSYLHQDPSSALTPTMRVRGQIAELSADRSLTAIGARLTALGLPGDRRFSRRYPHQLSGGQQQRLALARATAGAPKVLILDEPTTGLDPAARRRALEAIDALARERGLSLVMVTHDLPAAAALCDRVAVLRGGTLVEQGPVTDVLENPTAPYTRELVRAFPRIPDVLPAARVEAESDTALSASRPVPVVRVQGLAASHRDGRRRRTVVSGISFEAGPGECVALLGLSGSGKSTIARCVAGLHRPDVGTVELDGHLVAPDVRDRAVDERRRIQMVAQHSTGSFNPARTIGDALARPLRLLHGMDGEQAHQRTISLLDAVGLAARLAERRPGELSGGQCQRAAIARALAAEPSVLICDEMTSNLDAKVQADILDLVADLRADLRIAVLLITHDLGVLARAADRVLILEDGRLRQPGEAGHILATYAHPVGERIGASVAGS